MALLSMIMMMTKIIDDGNDDVDDIISILIWLVFSCCRCCLYPIIFV